MSLALVGPRVSGRPLTLPQAVRVRGKHLARVVFQSQEGFME